jgi:putative redox protein
MWSLPAPSDKKYRFFDLGISLPHPDILNRGSAISRPLSGRRKDALVKNVTARWTQGNEFRVDVPGGESQTLNSVPAAERPGSGPSPMEAVQGALAACTGMDVVMVLGKMRKTLKSLRIEVEGVRREEHPRIYTRLCLVYHIDGDDIDAGSAQKAVSLSQDKYCSVAGMLRPTVDLSYRLVLNGVPVEPLAANS